MFTHQKMGKLLEKEFFLFLSIKKLKKNSPPGTRLKKLQNNLFTDLG